MKKTLAKGMACLAFTMATVMPVAAQSTLPAELEKQCRGPQHPLNPFNRRPFTQDEQKTCGIVAASVLALTAGGVAACAFTRRKKPNV